MKVQEFNPKGALNFVEALVQNNNREWFLAHKSEFDDVMRSFKLFVTELALDIEKFDATFKAEKAENYVFRIYKDLRFSKDKIPYKNHIAAYICNGGRKSQKAGYYIHFEPNQCFIAAGIYKPDSKILKAVQKHIYYHANDFLAVVESSDMKTYFDGFMEDKIQKVPKDLPVDHFLSPYFTFKSYIFSKRFENSEINNHDFILKVKAAFKAAEPFNTFVNTAIDLIEN